MRIDIITIFPDIFDHLFEYSILGRAKKNNIIDIHIHNLRDYSKNKQKSVDDYQFGGGAGMVMMIQPIDDLISKLKSQRNYNEIIYLSLGHQKSYNLLFFLLLNPFFLILGILPQVLFHY